MRRFASSTRCSPSKSAPTRRLSGAPRRSDFSETNSKRSETQNVCKRESDGALARHATRPLAAFRTQAKIAPQTVGENEAREQAEKAKNAERIEATKIEAEKRKLEAKATNYDQSSDDEAAEPKTAEQIAEDEVEKLRLMPNAGNGSDRPKYSWTQKLDDLEASVPLRVGFKLRSHDLDVRIEKRRLRVGLRNTTPILDAELHAEIVLADGLSFWTLEDNAIVNVTMRKASTDGERLASRNACRRT